MAEVYGEKPRRFTREWWPYFWLYYKWHVIITVLVCLFLGIGITQCVKSEKFDLTVVYSGGRYIPDTEVEKIEEIVSRYVDDIDGDGKQNVFFEQLNVSSDKSDMQYNSAMQTKLLVEMQSNEAFIYIMDGDRMREILDNPNVCEAFVPVKEWAQDNVDEELMYGSDGEMRAVSLRNSRALTEAGIKCDDLYVFIMENVSEKGSRYYENDVKIANELIK